MTKLHSGTTSDALVANQLVPIKIEYTKSNADAMIQLLWQSISQPLANIDYHRLFRDTGHIAGSPYKVLPESIELQFHRTAVSASVPGTLWILAGLTQWMMVGMMSQNLSSNLWIQMTME